MVEVGLDTLTAFAIVVVAVGCCFSIVIMDVVAFGAVAVTALGVAPVAAPATVAIVCVVPI